MSVGKHKELEDIKSLGGRMKRWQPWLRKMDICLRPYDDD